MALLVPPERRYCSLHGGSSSASVEVSLLPPSWRPFPREWGTTWTGAPVEVLAEERFSS